MRQLARFVIIVFACAGAACDWPWQHDMANQPSRPASAGPRSPDPQAVSISAAPPLTREAAERTLHNPIPPSASIERGRRLYTIYCTPCHGSLGKGEGPVAQYFSPPVGDLTIDDIQRHDDGWFFATITNGTARMPRYAHELDVDERWEVVRFVRTLRSPAR